MIEAKCENASCGRAFKARKSDRDRGWGRFCSKSCKAIEQERRTGQYARHLSRQETQVDHPFCSGPFGHGQE